jgi:hypothetical protein
MLKKILFAVCCLLFALKNKAQVNLVPNSNFVQNDTCPDDYGEITRATYWTNANTGTSDYFNQCCPNGSIYVGIPYNSYGFQNAINNQSAYAGIIAIEPGSPNYREYIQAKLTNSLTIGQRYYATVYVSLLNGAQHAADGLGIYLSKTAVSRTDYSVLTFTPQIQNPAGHFLTDTLNWMRLSGSFIADSAYQYITIGNFKDDAHTDTIGVVASFPPLADAYYYLDNVCVSTDSFICNSVIGIESIKNNQGLFYYDNYNKKIVVKENGTYSLQITDILGSTRNEMRLQGNHSVDVSTYKAGCYIVTLNNQQGSSTKKIIISN